MASSPGLTTPQGDTFQHHLLPSSSNVNNTITVDSSAMDIEPQSPIFPTTPSAQLLKTPTIGQTLDFDFSSDPLSPGARTNLFSAALSAAKVLSRKREAASSTDNTHNSFSNKSLRTINKPTTAQEVILKVKELLIKASLLVKVNREQSKILDLLKIFREYTETEKVLSASKIVATQVDSLETTF